MVVKEECTEVAKEVFQGTGTSITEEGNRHLGAAIGNEAFVESYLKQKVSEWVNTVECLSPIAHSQPHAAYATFMHVLMSKWTYLTENYAQCWRPFFTIAWRR